MNELRSLCVLNILSDPLIAAFADRETDEGRTQFLRILYERSAEQNFAAYVANAVLTDENASSRACAAGVPVSDYLRRAYAADLESAVDVGTGPGPVGDWDDATPTTLAAY